MKKNIIAILVVVGIAAVAVFLAVPKTSKTPAKPEANKTAIPPSSTEFDNLIPDITQEFADKYAKSIDTIKVSVEKEEGNFAKGLISFTDEAGGAVWFGVRQGDKWKLAFDGQGPMSCTIAEQYAFPVSFVPTCIDEKQGSIINR